MLGGKLVATGSSSCIFKPNFPCKKTNKIDNSRISKIVYSPQAFEESKDEKRINDYIKKIRGYSKWAIIFDEYCKPMNSDLLEKYDREGINQCFNNEEDDYLIDDFDFNSYMMNGPYGGITLNEYFEDKLYNLIDNNKKFTDEFYNLMKKIEPLFLGLKTMNDKKLVHNDIKYNNIVLQDGVFKYIDFGLSELSSKKSHFKNRSLEEFNTGRIYLFYPLDYLLQYVSKQKVKEEITKIEKYNYRRNFEELNEVYLLFGRYLIDAYYHLQDTTYTETKMIQGIDTYSLGILIPQLFLFNTKFGETNYPGELFINNILSKNTMVQEFFTLFGMMTNPKLNERIKPEYSYKEFKRLLKKYNNSSKRSTKKTNKKIIKRKNKKSVNKKRSIISTKRKRNITPRKRGNITPRKRNITPRISERVNMRRKA